MKTDFSSELLSTPEGARANEILRSCVHCGFCNATCPTYQITGDELDGPRGRIYLIRDLLQETAEEPNRAVKHLDRCLTCRACETTCPSGVAYGELAEIARTRMGPSRSGIADLTRRLLRWVVPYRNRFGFFINLGQWFRRVLPAKLQQYVPVRRTANQPSQNLPVASEVRGRVLLLQGCTQQAIEPEVNQHVERLLRRLGYEVVYERDERCCGSLPLHLGDETGALKFARANIDLWFEKLDTLSFIVSTASGCGVTVKDYGRLLTHDPDYAERAQAVVNKTCDIAELVAHHADELLAAHKAGTKVAWHPPCTWQHGQKIEVDVEQMLASVGYTPVAVEDTHLCCGSAGTYSILQPELSAQLKDRKLDALTRHRPDVIASANVGCQMHLRGEAGVPVVHWLELLE